tara:strand:+ start:307 stop:600 length:294 start_codon:yes stop_codon:yes gene_type:complete
MTRLDENAVTHLATLARLQLDSEEVGELQHDLERILGYVAQLETLPTDEVRPTSHGVELADKFREDIRGQGIERDRALEQAPEKLGDGFGVPKVIES